MGKYRLIVFLMVLAFMLLTFTVGEVLAQDLKLDAQGAILMDADSGKILWEQNAHKKWYPASMTKVMTMVLTLEAIKEGRASLNDTVVTSENAASLGGSQVWLEPGEQLSLEKMLIAVAVGSANDASLAIAEHLGGSEESFAKMMNDKAKEIGCQNTHFINSHGLHDDKHYTSPYDMALICRYALKNYPEILNYTSIKEYTFRNKPELVLYNTNKNLWWYPGTDGLKTGTTDAALRNLSSTVKKDGLRLITVVMGVPQRNYHFSESMRLYNWGFAQYTFKNFYKKGDRIATLRVAKGKADKVTVVAGDDVGATVAKGEKKKISLKLALPEILEAPLIQGQKVGEALVMVDGKLLARKELVAAEQVVRGSIWRQIGKVLSGAFAIL